MSCFRCSLLITTIKEHWPNYRIKLHMTSPPRSCREIKKQRLFYMQQNTAEQLAHSPSALWHLSSFVSLWLKRPSDYCSLLAGACPMPTKPETHKRLLLVFTGGGFQLLFCCRAASMELSTTQFRLTIPEDHL
jgi:hypothetical protein